MTAIPVVLAMPIRAYSYLRISRKPRPGGDSRRRQSVSHDRDELTSGGMAALAATICMEEGAILDDTLTFEDLGVSGRHGKNATVGALSRFLDFVKRGRIAAGSVLIFENIDRMSRDKLPKAMKLFLGILEAGIIIRTARPCRRYTIDSVSELGGIIEPLIEMIRAYEESERKSVLLGQMWGRKRVAARKGQALGRKCPAWLELADAQGLPVAGDRRTREGDQYRLRPGPARTVESIFTLAIEGRGRQRIVQWLRERPEVHPSIGYSPDWSEEYVGVILRSPSAMGVYQPHKTDAKTGKRVPDGEPIPDFYPAVVTEDVWRQAQDANRGRRKSSGRPGEKEVNLFTGIAFHAGTRNRLCVKSQKIKGKRYAYLTYFQDHGRSRCASGTGCRYDQFEEGVLEAVRELRPEDVLPADLEWTVLEKKIAELTSRVVALDQRGREIQKEIEDPANAVAVSALAKSLGKTLAEKTETARVLDVLKIESQTGRGESLGELQSLCALLLEARGTDGEAELRLRTKGAIRQVIEEVWLLPQVITRQKVILHVQIYLRGGQRKYTRVLPSSLRGCGAAPPWFLRESDFRAGDVGEAALKPGFSKSAG